MVLPPPARLPAAHAPPPNSSCFKYIIHIGYRWRLPVAAMEMIAHRGGVVDERHAENSLSGLREAHHRGYCGVELDVRLTADGALLVHHDPHFGKIFGQPERLVGETTAAEAAALRGDPGGEAPRLWAAACAAVADVGLAVMVDIKVAKPSDEVLAEVEGTLAQHGLLDEALFLTDIPRVGEWFAGKARTALRVLQLRALLADGSDDSDHESLGRRHFLFDHGNVLTPSDIHLAQQHSIEVIPSVNVFHYKGVAPMVGAARDLAMLAEAGVGRVQLDSVFEALCTNSPRI